MSLAPLFRLLDDLDILSTSNSQIPARRTPNRIFTPNFDIRETATAYELYGELPGLERQDVQIELIDENPQTLVVSRRATRGSKNQSEQTAGTRETAVTAKSTQSNTAEEEDSRADETSEEAAVTAVESSGQTEAEADWEEVRSTTSTSSSSGSTSTYHHPTVEDADEDGVVNQSSAPISTPSLRAGGVPQPTASTTPTQGITTVSPTTVPTSQDRYILHERPSGSFSRAFRFATRVDPDGVSATLENGLLRVVVPKAKEWRVRRVIVG